jgi:hypothetical protein
MNWGYYQSDCLARFFVLLVKWQQWNMKEKYILRKEKQLNQNHVALAIVIW